MTVQDVNNKSDNFGIHDLGQTVLKVRYVGNDEKAKIRIFLKSATNYEHLSINVCFWGQSIGVLTLIYIIFSNWDVKSEYLVIHGFAETVFKVLVLEKG